MTKKNKELTDLKMQLAYSDFLHSKRAKNIFLLPAGALKVKMPSTYVSFEAILLYGANTVRVNQAYLVSNAADSSLR